MITGDTSVAAGIDVTSSRERYDERMLVDRLCHGPRKQVAIDGERRPSRDARDFGGVHHERIQPAHLLFQQSDRVVELVAPERVAAHQLGETVRLVDVGGPSGPHFVDGDGYAASGSLPGSLAAGQAASNDADWA